MIRRLLRDERGSVSVQALLLLGLFMLMLAFVAEFGALRSKTLRLQAAFDRAALAAAGAIDPVDLASNGRLTLDGPAAGEIAREYLASNLAPFESGLADQSAAQVVAAAQVGVSDSPVPSVTLSGAVDLPSGLLALIGAGETVTYRIRSTSNLEGP